MEKRTARAVRRVHEGLRVAERHGGARRAGDLELDPAGDVLGEVEDIHARGGL